ncbi:MAG TPA: hypothetical protein VKB10_03350 [Gaiellaceae bacterium]|nr:hypothetical protein [Gaiellaceae bacterium]
MVATRGSLVTLAVTVPALAVAGTSREPRACAARAGCSRDDARESCCRASARES